MNIELKGKVVLITGASSGFGMDAARLFAYEGCSVILAARRIDRLQELAASIQAQGGEAFDQGGDREADALGLGATELARLGKVNVAQARGEQDERQDGEGGEGEEDASTREQEFH
jgi:NAD(P)-dependent dehydrogenase (short-subunit alcohol dehydrogenase family)